MIFYVPSLVSGSWRGEIKVWELNIGKLPNTLEGQDGDMGLVAITPDSTKVVSITGDKIKVWELNTGKLMHTLEGHDQDIGPFAITSDSTKIVSGSLYEAVKY